MLRFIKNSWDEICVQVQDEYSIYWYAYLFVIEKFVSSDIEDIDVKDNGDGSFCLMHKYNSHN